MGLHTRLAAFFGMTVIIRSPLVAVIIALCFLTSASYAGRHVRLYACVLASDAPGSFMGGSSLGSGLWVSDDTARTWRQVGWKHVKCYSVDVEARSNGKTIYLACGNGLMKSTDEGVSWKIVTDHRITEVLDVRVDPADTKLIHIATATGIWRSTDGGTKWVESMTGLEDTYTSRLAYDARNTGYLFATTETGLYRSTTAGTSWEYYSIADRAAYRSFSMDPHIDILVVGDSGVVHHEHRKSIREPEFYGDLWACDIFRRDAVIAGAKGGWIIDNDMNIDTLIAAPRNIHDMAEFSKVLILGTLGDGVWKYMLGSLSSVCHPAGLEKAQVWTVRAYPIHEEE